MTKFHNKLSKVSYIVGEKFLKINLCILSKSVGCVNNNTLKQYIAIEWGFMIWLHDAKLIDYNLYDSKLAVTSLPILLDVLSKHMHKPKPAKRICPNSLTCMHNTARLHWHHCQLKIVQPIHNPIILIYTPVHLVESVENCGLCMGWHLACSSYANVIGLRTCNLRVRFVMTPAPGIKLCAIAAYRLFHSRAQLLTFTDSTRWTGV